MTGLLFKLSVVGDDSAIASLLKESDSCHCPVGQ